MQASWSAERLVFPHLMAGAASTGFVAIVCAFAGGIGLAGDDALVASHRPAQHIQVVSDGEKLTTFAVDGDGRLVAGVKGTNAPSLRIYDAQGAKLDEWVLPIAPEAVGVRPDGHVIVGGQGTLLVLDAGGKELVKRQAPHMRTAVDAAKEIKGRVQKQRTADARSKLNEQIETYKKRLVYMEKKLAEVDEAIIVLDKRESEADDEEQRESIADERQTLHKRRATCLKLQLNLEANIRNPPSPTGRSRKQAPPPEPSLEQLVAAQGRIASISASQKDIVYACSSSTGSGYDVWRTDFDFEAPVKIGQSLRGCCGQMDVQVNDNGIYVAENTRHRVRCYTRDGKEQFEFGSRERDRPDSFDGCCNPMNVAFGADGSIYTAEAGIGRIKRFAKDGSFQQLVGQVDLVPGCKKVSISVSPSGDLIYMLDITRGHIVAMVQQPLQADAVPQEQRTGLSPLAAID